VASVGVAPEKARPGPIPAGVRAIALWAAFLIPAATVAYGLLSAHLFAQQVWSVEGLRRFAWFAAAYLAAALLLLRLRPGVFLPAAGGFGLFAALVSVGFGAIGAAIFLSAAALLLGDAALRWLGIPRDGRPFAESAALSFLAGTALIVFAVGLAAHRQINYRSVYLLALALPLAANRRALPYYWSGFARALQRRSSAAGGLLGFVLIAQLLVALKPEVGYDALAMHLMLPSYVGAHHFWPFDAASYIWAVSPLAGDWLYTAAYLLGGEFAARLANFLLLIALLALLYCFARRHLPRAPAVFATALFASIPMAQLVTGSLFIENFLAAMIVAALLAIERLHQSRRPAHLVLAGLFLGTAFAAKFGTLTCAVALVPFAVFAVRRSRGPSLRFVLMAIAVAAAAAAPAYLWAWHKMGSAIYPYASPLFRSPFPGGTIPAWNSLYSLTFDSHRYLESQDGALGFQFLLLLPLTLTLFLRRTFFAARAAMATALVSAVLVLGFQPYLRYLYPALALLSIPFADFAAWSRRRYPVLYRAVGFACGAVILLNLYFLPSSGWYQRGFFLWPAEREPYVRAMAPARGLIEYLNLTSPREPAWFIQTNHIAGLQGHAYSANWHQPPFAAAVHSIRTPDDALRLARQHGIRHFLALDDLSSEAPALRAFLAQDTTSEFRYGSMSLYRLHDAFQFTSELLGEDSRWQGWQRNGHVVTDDSGAARVTVTDTLVRRVDIDEDVTYRYSIEAYCPAETLARLQVNWHDAAGRFLGTSIEPRACGPEWRTFTTDFQPPQGTHSGVVIVGGHTPSPVLVRHVSLKF
jgi:hypothetical protein